MWTVEPSSQSVFSGQNVYVFLWWLSFFVLSESSTDSSIQTKTKFRWPNPPSTCPDPHLGSWNCLPHQAHIAMKWADQQHWPAGFESRSFSTSPSLYPHFNRPSGFWPCVKSCLVGWQRQIIDQIHRVRFTWPLSLKRTWSHYYYYY